LHVRQQEWRGLFVSCKHCTEIIVNNHIIGAHVNTVSCTDCFKNPDSFRNTVSDFMSASLNYSLNWFHSCAASVQVLLWVSVELVFGGASIVTLNIMSTAFIILDINLVTVNSKYGILLKQFSYLLLLQLCCWSECLVSAYGWHEEQHACVILLKYEKHTTVYLFASLEQKKRLYCSTEKNEPGCFQLTQIILISILQNQLTQSSSALESAEELLEFANTALHITDEGEFTKVRSYWCV